MKYTLAIWLLLLSTSTTAQRLQIAMSEEFKLNRGGSTFNTLLADDEYVYLAETNTKTGVNLMGVRMSLTEANLLKLDKNFNKVLERSYDDDLKKKAFHSIQVLGEELYLFATTTSKDELQITVYGAKLDKADGSIIGSELAELASFDRDDRKEAFRLQLMAMESENGFLIGAIPANRQMKLQLFDKDLKRKEKLLIQLPYQDYLIDQFSFSSKGQIVVLQKGYAPIEPGSKYTEVVKYVLTVYNRSGKKEHEFKVERPDFHPISTGLAEGPDDVWTLAGLYSNDHTRKITTGYFVYKVNVANGQTNVSKFNAFNSDMLVNGTPLATVKKGKDETLPGLDGAMVTKDLKVDPTDGSILLVAEDSRRDIVYGERSTVTPPGGIGPGYSNTYEEFHNRDLLLMRLTDAGQLTWASLIRKAQKEKYLLSFGGYGPSIMLPSRSKESPRGGGEVTGPYYSSYRLVVLGQKMLLLLNDDEENLENPPVGAKVKPEPPVGKRAALFAIWVDISTGKMTKQLLQEDDGDRSPYIRFAILHKTHLLIPYGNTGWGTGKAKLSFGRLTLPKN